LFCCCSDARATVHALARCYHGGLAYWFGQTHRKALVLRVPASGLPTLAFFSNPHFHLFRSGQPREGTMRDIRGDLQERAILVDEQIRAAVAHFDKAIQQLQTERDARTADLKAGLAMIAKFMEFEERFLHT